MAPDSRKLQRPGDAPQIGESLVKPYSYKTALRLILGVPFSILWPIRIHTHQFRLEENLYIYMNQSGQLIVIHQTEKNTGIRASISYPVPPVEGDDFQIQAAIFLVKHS